MVKVSGVYLVSCLANGRKYVGSSCNIKRRWNEHRTLLKQGKHYNRHWQNAWNKYGADQFQWSIIEIVTPDSVGLTDREQHWIDALKPELNLSSVSFPTNLGLKRSVATNEKHSDAMRAAWARRSEDERLELRKKASHKVSDETREILRQKSNDWQQDNQSYWTGKHRSEETKRKLREAALRQFAKQREEKEQKRIEWEAGRAEREQIRIEKIRKANTGKRVSDETKKKLSAIAKKQMSDPDMQEKHRLATQEAMKRPDVIERLSEAHKGKRLTEAQKKKIGEAHKGRKRSPEAIENLKRGQQRRRAREKASQP